MGIDKVAHILRDIKMGKRPSDRHQKYVQGGASRYKDLTWGDGVGKFTDEQLDFILRDLMQRFGLNKEGKSDDGYVFRVSFTYH